MKRLASHLKYCYGACIKWNRHWTAEELSVLVQNILHDICGCHDSCYASWCYDKKAIQEKLPHHPPSDHRLEFWTICFSRNDALLQSPTRHSDQWSTQPVYCQHCTEKCCYSGSTSLYNRIALVIGMHNMGHCSFFVLFRKVGVSMTTGLNF
jgi:hypothetical protein